MSRHVPVPTEDAPSWAADLSLRERAFVQEYIVDLNGRAAGVRAGLGKNPKSAGEMAAKLRAKPHVAAAISALMNEKHGIVGARVVAELGAIAYTRMTDFVRLDKGRLVLKVKDLDELPDEAKAAIAKLKERENDDGSISIEVELHDKLSALDKLGKSIGLFKEHEVSVLHTVKFVDPISRIKERLNALKRAREVGPISEIDSPPKRIAPPQPQPQTIDAQAE
jgi:phage terminase small subunit